MLSRMQSKCSIKFAELLKVVPWPKRAKSTQWAAVAEATCALHVQSNALQSSILYRVFLCQWTFLFNLALLRTCGEWYGCFQLSADVRFHLTVNSNSNSSICSAPCTVSAMTQSIVSERCMLSWIRMSLDDVLMLLSTSVWVSFLSVADSTHEVQRQATHGRRIAARSVEERGCSCWRRATTSVMAC